MKQVPADEEYRQPLAFIGIGSSNESDMQQIMIEDKVRLHAVSKACTVCSVHV